MYNTGFFYNKNQINSAECYLNTIAAAVPLSFKQHPNHINNKQQSDRFEKQSSNTKPEKIFTAIIIPAAVLAIGVLTLALTQKEKTPEPQTSAHKALKDASNGIFWLKSKEEISKSIKIFCCNSIYFVND